MIGLLRVDKCPAAHALRGYVRSFFGPIERLLPSYWCEKYIELPPGKQESKAGPVSFAKRPFQREPLDSFADPSVRDIVFVGPTRIGKTFFLRMALAWSIAASRAATLWVDANETTAKRVSKKELRPMIEYNAVLRERKPANRHSVTDLQILFPAAAFTMVGGHSADQVAGDTVVRIFGNEMDKWSDASEKEASIAELVRHRTESADDERRHGWSSTPTIEEGQTWQYYLRGDQRKWFGVCRRCGTPQQLEWGDRRSGHGVKWSPAAQIAHGKWDLDMVKATARYSCANVGCSAHDPDGSKVSGWTDAERLDAICDDRAHWRATTKGQPGWRSYHINGLYGPLKANTPSELAVDFLAVRTTGFIADRQDFWNSRMGLPWKDDISDVTAEKFAQRESPPPPFASYYRGALPANFTPDWLITGFDVQSNRLPYVVRGGDWAGNSFTIDHGDAPTWVDLENVQAVYHRKWPRAVNYVIGDINYEDRRAETMEQLFARRHLGWYGAEGFDQAKDLCRLEQANPFLGGRLTAHGHKVPKLVISTYEFKVELEKKFSGEVPNWFSYQLPPLAASEGETEEQRDYYAQLLDEHRRPRKFRVAGKPPFEWVSRRKNNHAFDCEVYILALFWVLQKQRAYAARAAAGPRRTMQVSTS